LNKGNTLQLSNLSRRDLLKLFVGTGAALALPNTAFAVTEEEVKAAESNLAAAQAQLEAVQKQLDAIAREYEALSVEQSKTLSQIEETRNDIKDAQQKLEDKQKVLSKRIASAYKAGGSDVLEVLLASSSFEELASNIYYMDKISENDRQMIDSVKELKASLEQQQAELEELNERQKAQLAEMQAKQVEAQKTIEGLSQDVKNLMAQRDAALQAMAAEKAAQEAAAAAAARAGSRTVDVTGALVESGATGSQQAVVASCYSTPSPGAGLCAMWVSQVFSNAGYPYASGNANDMFNSYCYSSNKSELKPGMIVAVNTHAGTSAGRIYGHIGIYIGGGTVMHNVGYVETVSLDQWISDYGTTVTPRWGWLMGIELD
jgi:peptidoglycan hydrolase CwlO-like protein